MDLNIVLWLGGMLFSLGIFAMKVGFGLGYGGFKRNGVLVTLFVYLVLFIAIAMLSGHLIKLLEPVLRKGPYLHALMSLGMIGWGIYLFRRQGIDTLEQVKEQQTNSRSKIQDSRFKIQNSKINNSELSTLNSLLLLIPCPVCLSAMTFSTGAALNVIQLPSYIVGLGLGIVFAGLSLLFLAITKLKSPVSPQINLGLSMMAIGVYFLSSLVLPAKIEEARGVYQSFLTEGANIDINNSIGVFAILFVGLLIGFLKKSFSGLTRESKTKELDSPIKSGNDI